MIKKNYIRFDSNGHIAKRYMGNFTATSADVDVIYVFYDQDTNPLETSFLVYARCTTPNGVNLGPYNMPSSIVSLTSEEAVRFGVFDYSMYNAETGLYDTPCRILTCKKAMLQAHGDLAISYVYQELDTNGVVIRTCVQGMDKINVAEAVPELLTEDEYLEIRAETMPRDLSELVATEEINNTDTIIVNQGGTTNKKITKDNFKETIGINDLDNKKVNVTDIVNDLITGGIGKPLSAEQGKTLNTNVSNKIDKDFKEYNNVVPADEDLILIYDSSGNAIGKMTANEFSSFINAAVGSFVPNGIYTAEATGGVGLFAQKAKELDAQPLLIKNSVKTYTMPTSAIKHTVKITKIEGEITQVINNQFVISQPTEIVCSSSDLMQSKEYPLNIPANFEFVKTPNGVGNEWYPSGDVKENLCKIIIDGVNYKAISQAGVNANNLLYLGLNVDNLGMPISSATDTNKEMSNIMPQGYVAVAQTTERFNIFNNNGVVAFRMLLDTAKLAGYGYNPLDNTTYINAANAYFAANNITIYYQLASASPYSTISSFDEYIDTYIDGSISIDSGLMYFEVPIDVTAQLNINVERIEKHENRLDILLPIVNVNKFGAVGDGITDDTTAILNVISSITTPSILMFESGKKYKISNTLSLNVATIRGVIGNNASLISDSDIIMFHLFGGLTTGTADPTNANTISQKFNINTFISNLQIYNTAVPILGTGIKITGTFGTRIEGCHIFDLKVGILITETNRNIIITNNHIWNCLDYCLHYYQANVHQSIINNNHMSYAKIVLYIENGDVHNIQIVGNDLENGANETHENVIKFLATQNDVQISQFQIVGNSIEEHHRSDKGVIFFECLKDVAIEIPPAILLWEIVGNEISGSYYGIILKNANDGVISGNNIKNMKEYAIKIIETSDSLNINGNTISGMNHTLYGGGVLIFESLPGKTNYIGDTNFTNNVCSQLTKNPISIVGIAHLYETIISNNSFLMVTDMGDVTPLLYGYMFNIETTTILSLIVKDNILRGRNYNEHGMKIIVTGATDNTIIKNNIIRGLVARESIDPIYYSLPSPSATVIISENIPTA